MSDPIGYDGFVVRELCPRCHRFGCLCNDELTRLRAELAESRRRCGVAGEALRALVKFDSKADPVLPSPCSNIARAALAELEKP